MPATNFRAIPPKAFFKIVGDATSSAYAKMANGLLPRGFKISERSVRFFEHEAHAINAARASGASEDEIRQLVAELMEARESALESWRDGFKAEAAK